MLTYTLAKRTTPPINIALHKATAIPILTFDNTGKLDVFLFDDTLPIVNKMGLAEENRIAPFHLCNALILYSLAQDLGLEPGHSTEDDEDIFSYIKEQISPHISEDQHDTLIAELTGAWYRIAGHPIVQGYLKNDRTLRRADPGSSNAAKSAFLPYIGPFMLFIYEYITTYLKVLSTAHIIGESTALLLQLNALVFTALKGSAFSITRQQQINDLVKTIALLKENVPHEAPLLNAISAQLQSAQGRLAADFDDAFPVEIEAAVNTRLPHALCGTPDKEAALLQKLAQNPDYFSSLPRYAVKMLCYNPTATRDHRLKGEAQQNLAIRQSLQDVNAQEPSVKRARVALPLAAIAEDDGESKAPAGIFFGYLGNDEQPAAPAIAPAAPLHAPEDGPPPAYDSSDADPQLLDPPPQYNARPF